MIWVLKCSYVETKVKMKQNKSMRNKQKTRYGIFYRSNGRWTSTPYRGATFTKYTMSRNPIREDIKLLQNRVLKSRLAILPVA
jgi:hypothetical protein